jgi:hypothetical protein
VNISEFGLLKTSKEISIYLERRLSLFWAEDVVAANPELPAMTSSLERSDVGPLPVLETFKLCKKFKKNLSLISSS